MAKTNTGKVTEKAVHDALKKFDDLPQFDWQRMYDATSARGAFMNQTGDFEFFLPKVHGVIEVKSTQHPNRLARRAFSDLQRAKLYRRMQAGGQVFVIVHHYTVGQWKLIPFDACHQAFSVDGQASIVTDKFFTTDNEYSVVAELLKEVVNASSTPNAR